VTVLLTLALGIGANAAIFTLVNAILLHNLPVTDPRTLIRIGDKDDCCVNSGWNDEGDYSLFSTDTYFMLKKNLPEFEELAAMEQGEPDLNKGASVVKGSSEYFDSVGTRVVMGRGFRPQDTLNAAPVAVVNQEFVKQFFGKRNPIGHSFGPSGPGQAGRDGAHEIVGVVEDTTYTSIYWKNHAMYFLPLTQRSGSANDPDYHLDKDQSMYAGALVIQTGHPIAGFEKTVSETLASINPNLTIVKFQTFRQQIDDRFIQERLIARLTSLFGLLALLLAAIGLYGVTAYTVVRRTPEIGIRMALGAARSRVIGTVMGGAMLQAVAGLAIGIPVAIFCVRYVKSQLFEITSVNVPVMGIAIGVLVITAAVAGIIPARRAASIDPVRALRIE
jgi:macrolide transport system ATP-binding/permease protein